VRPPNPAAKSPLTWALALALFVVAGGVVAHTGLLWGKTALWVSGDFDALGFYQGYETARKLFRPRPDADIRVAILGNSRVWFPGRDPYIEREFHRQAPQLNVRVDDLAVFGMRIGDLEIMSRHLDRLRPTHVVFTLAGSDLVPTKWGKLLNITGRWFNTGWKDGPLPPQSQSGRVDRWLKTAWPFYRVRIFARSGLEDLVWPDPTDVRFPDHFDSSRAVFDFLDGDKAPEIEAAYREVERAGTLDAFLLYLKARTGMWGVVEPVPDPSTLTVESPGARVLDRLLERLAAGPWSSLVLLMPENPVFEQDTEGKYHRPGFSDHASAIVRRIADRHGVRVADGRRWMPASAFLDFVHLMPDVSGFQKPLVHEVLRDAPA
jgi:hypothetical protein